MTHDKPDAKAPINNPASDPPGRNGDDEPNEETYWDLRPFKADKSRAKKESTRTER